MHNNKLCIVYFKTLSLNRKKDGTIILQEPKLLCFFIQQFTTFPAIFNAFPAGLLKMGKIFYYTLV